MTNVAGNPGRVCVYYDGGCPLCRAEIAAYRRLEGSDQLDWIDASDCSPQVLGHDLDRDHALTRLHLRRADGTLVDGAAAFVELWSVLPAWRWLASLGRWPGMLPLMELAYRVFLKVRKLWRRPEVSS